MTMRVVYLKDHDGHKQDKDYFIERTLGRRLCSAGVTIPHSTHMENLKQAEDEAKAKKERAKKEAAAKAKAEKESEEKARVEKLLKEKEEKARETADSKPAKMRSKSIRK